MPDQEGQKERDALYRVRHSASHILATAVLEIFPEAKLAIGPPIKDGFYYDFDLPEGKTFTPEILEQIEERMSAVVKENQKFEQTSWSKDKAREFFADQPYKLELIDRIEGDEVSIYTNGPFTDLCAGPHVGYTKQCKHFKLLKVAGAYWKGDENQPMLQRIYGTAWKKKADLENYLHVLEEAKRRDHRRLGKELELFGFDRLSPGSVFWRPKGWTCYRELQKYFRQLEGDNGYEEIFNPLLYSKELFETSGHWDHYRENMFTFKSEDGEQTYCLKPMNCPDTMLYFKSKKRSYRELPLRVAEFGVLHRNELAGALAGATRVRQMMQDDGHIFCTEDQIAGEVKLFLEMVDQTYGLFDLHYDIELSTRPDDFMGEVELWDKAEAGLKRVLDELDRPYLVNEGDGAFYGPKIDIQVRDSLGRSWQCATVQLDFQLPRRFDLGYAASDNTEKTPVVIHRAIAGSLERFFAILVEHFAGAFPTWLAPVQAVLVPITDEQNDYAWDVARKLKAAGVRVEVDDRNEKMGYKIREHETSKVPYMLVVGGREAEAGQLNVRTYSGGRRGTMDVQEVVDEIAEAIRTRKLDVEVERSQLTEASLEEDEVGSDMVDRGY